VTARRRIERPLYLLLMAAASLVSCTGQPLLPSQNSGRLRLQARAQSACYNGDHGVPTTVKARTTFYGWWDNTPPGGAIAHPIIHATAGGVGSYCDPTTFATEPTKTENAEIPFGTRIYIPFLHKYFLREDDCTPSGPKSGSGSNGCYGLWFDNWIGGNAQTKKARLFHCEIRLTPTLDVDVIVHPHRSQRVNWRGPIYSNTSGCDRRKHA
jgi:hypothetical protein